MKRALTMTNLINKRDNILSFEGEWQLSFGNPARSGSWIIWGESGQGKTSFVMQLLKYLSTFDSIRRVAFVSLEEGDSVTVVNTLQRVKMQEVEKKFRLYKKLDINELREVLSVQRSPDVIAIDSIQYFCLNYPAYTKLINDFPDKLFILISHADGRHPAGRSAKSIRFDAFVKVRIEGYAAFAVSRYANGESKPFLIWQEGAQRYHGTKILTK